MSLGTKIKEVLRGPNSPETAEGDQSVPGSFPSDDTPSNVAKTPGQATATGPSNLQPSGSQKQKLHKREDPRGWDDPTGAPPGHTHTDSGVGLTAVDYPAYGNAYKSDNTAGSGLTGDRLGGSERHVEKQNSTAYPPANAPAEQRSAAVGIPAPSASTHDHSQKPTEQQAYSYGGAAPSKTSDTTYAADGSKTSGALAGVGSTGVYSKPNEDHNVVRSGHGTSSTVGKDPYWGDIPRGVGVYNTVTGHGSQEDGDRHGHQVPQTMQSSDNAAASLGPQSGRADVTQRSTPLETSEQQSHQNEGHSKFTEKAGLAGAAAGTGAAAYGLNKKHQESKEQKPHDYNTGTDPAEKDSKTGKLTGIFHRDHKDDHEKSHKHERTHEDKTEYTSKEPHRHQAQQSQDTRAFGLAGRDQKTERPTEQPQHQTQPVVGEQRHQGSQEKHDHRKDEATAAAAAAYTAHVATEDHSRKQDKKEADHEAHKEKKESKLHALFHRGHKDKDEKPAKEEKHHEHKEKEHHHKSVEQKTAVAAAPLPPARQERADPAADHDRSAAYTAVPDATTDRTKETTKHDNKHSAVPLGLAAAGAGGYAASRLAGSKDEHKQPTQEQPQASDISSHLAKKHAAPVSNVAAATSQDKSQQLGSHPPTEARGRTMEEQYGAMPPITHGHGSTVRQEGDFNKPKSGTSALPVPAYQGASSLAQSSQTPSHQATSSNTASTTTPATHPTKEDPSQGGLYNVLSSGTPSGINIQGTKSSASRTDATAQPMQHATEQKDHSSYTTYAIPAAAAAGGAGATYAATRGQHHSEEVPKPSEQQQPAAQTQSYSTRQAQPTQLQSQAVAPAQLQDKSAQAPQYGTAALAGGQRGAGMAPGSVVHQCVKCGEANDITHYFNKM